MLNYNAYVCVVFSWFISVLYSRTCGLIYKSHVWWLGLWEYSYENCEGVWLTRYILSFWYFIEGSTSVLLSLSGCYEHASSYLCFRSCYDISFSPSDMGLKCKQTSDLLCIALSVHMLLSSGLSQRVCNLADSVRLCVLCDHLNNKLNKSIFSAAFYTSFDTLV